MNSNTIPTISCQTEQGADGEFKNKQIGTTTNKVKPPIPVKPGSNKTNKPPPVKRKPFTKSQSVDSYSSNTKQHAGVDLTQIGDSEWRDFVLKRKESEDDDDELLTPTIQSLNLHRKSLTGAEQIIVEDEVLTPVPLDETEITTKDTNSNMPTPVEAELKTTEKPEDDVFTTNNETTTLSDIKHENESDILNGECTKETVPNGINGIVDTTTTTTTKETHTETTTPVAITLPKPRQIVSEIKRKSFASSRSMSLPSTQLGLQLRRGSDILKEANAQYLKEANAQTPYFCRLSRGSVDLLESPNLPGLNSKEVSESNEEPSG